MKFDKFLDGFSKISMASIVVYAAYNTVFVPVYNKHIVPTINKISFKFQSEKAKKDAVKTMKNGDYLFIKDSKGNTVETYRFHDGKLIKII